MEMGREPRNPHLPCRRQKGGTSRGSIKGKPSSSFGLELTEKEVSPLLLVPNLTTAVLRTWKSCLLRGMLRSCWSYLTPGMLRGC